MCSYMVVCALYPRFELLAALGDRRALISEPAALAPEAGREQVVGEVSAPAEAYGIVRGMRLGEAMSRCPALRLIPPDPEGVRSLWNTVLDRLEAIGAAVESDEPGAAFFESAGIWLRHDATSARAPASAPRPAALPLTRRRCRRARAAVDATAPSLSRRRPSRLSSPRCR
jgi:protein ImuB